MRLVPARSGGKYGTFLDRLRTSGFLLDLFRLRVRGETEPSGHHVGGHVREPASLRVGMGAEPDEGFFDADSELSSEHSAGLVDLRPVSAQVLDAVVRRRPAGRRARLVDPCVQQEQRREIGERQ